MATVEIPSRSLFKAPEVCEIAQVQSYVLRSWEAEFPDLGVAKGANGSRLYRKADLERVLRIKHLLFVEGLTLAGARRRLEEEGPAIHGPAIEELLAADARERIGEVRQGLRWILDLLGRTTSASIGGVVTAPALFEVARAKKAAGSGAGRKKRKRGARL
jgi:DNA-binding transcriptional MerR regulator